MGLLDGLMPDESMGMPNGMGGQPDKMSGLLNNPALQMGLGILANNQGNYGSFGAALGRGGLTGMQNLQRQQESMRQQKIMDLHEQQMQAQQAEAQRKAARDEENSKMIYEALGLGQQPPTQNSGDIPNNYAPNPPKEFNRDAIQKLGLITSINGGRGGDALMKYAESKKPNWQNVGGKFVDANQYQGEIPISPAPMSESEKIRMQYEGMIPQDNLPQPTQQQSGNPMSSMLPPASQRKVAEAQALQEVQDNSPKAQAERLKIEKENLLAEEKKQRSIQGRQSQANVIIGKVDEALSKTNGWSTGFVGSQLGKISGTNAYDLKKAVTTVKANIGFQELQAMRDASPTGGALGAIAVQELEALQSTLASLDEGQSQDVLKQNLNQIKTHYKNVLDTIEGRTPQGFGNIMSGSEKITPSQPAKKSVLKGQVYKGHKFLGGDPSNPANWTKQ